MYSVSAAYRETIQLHRTQGVRNRSYAQIYIGQFDSDARGDATPAISDTGARISDFGIVNTDAVQGAAYAGWEQSFFRLDGVQKFLPDDTDDLKTQGFVSSQISGADGSFAQPIVLTIVFSSLHRMSGITLLFDDTSDAYAASFNISTYYNDMLVESNDVVNTEAKYEGILTLDYHNRMVITFNATARPYQRLRLQHILFGIGFVYGNDAIMEIALNRSTSPVSLELPANKLTYSLHNEDGIFTPDNESSVSSFFSDDQECKLLFGYDVNGSGDTEWIGTGKFWLAAWTAEGITARFEASDIIERMSATTYRKGSYGDKTARALIDDVMSDFGYDDYDASVFELGNTYIRNPLPIASHAECLQLIANYAMCTLEPDADGVIIFRTRTDATPAYIIPRHTEAFLPGSDADNLTDYETEITEYASWEQDGFALSGDMLFVPDDGESFVNNGLGWNYFPKANGRYAIGASVYFDFAANVSFGSVVVDFGPNFVPSIVKIWGLRDEDGSYTTVYDKEWSISSPHTVIIDNFDRIVHLEFYILGNDKAQRPRIQRVAFSWENGYEITAEDIFNNPKGSKLTNCRNVIVYLDNRTAEEEAEIKTATVTAGVEAWIEHGDMYQDVTASTTTEGATLDYTSYAYATRVLASGVTGEVEITLTGKRMVQGAEDVRTVAINPTGEDCEIENPLLSASSIKDGYLDWLAAYFGRNVEWNAETLGYPELQPGDLIGYKGMQASILEANITYKYSLREQFVLRKEETV